MPPKKKESKVISKKKDVGSVKKASPKKKEIEIDNSIIESSNDNKTIEDKYKKYTQIQHILERPDSYLGELKHQLERHFICVDNEIIRKEILYSPGFMKIFDEILVNACDHHKCNPTCNKIWVSIIKVDDKYIIKVKNNGPGIDVVIHKEHAKYVAELIFGELLTSSNYDDTEQRTTGGRNGYGAKLTNIYSKKFTLETVDGKKKLKYYQEFSNNMSERTEPEITKCKDQPYTEISYEPDLERFNMTEISDDVIALMKRRVYDIAGTLDKITVYFNDADGVADIHSTPAGQSGKIETNTFEKYINLYKFGDENEIIYEKVNDRWKVGAIYDPEYGASNISFVNSINTYHGGNHVNYVLDNITNRLKEILLKKQKNMDAKHINLKQNLILFVDSTIVNPSFTSQTKETLKTKVSEFGSKCEVSDKFITKLSKTGIFDQAIMMAKVKEQTIMKKTDGKKTSSIRGIPKLEDANWAGTKNSSKTLLFLVEGDSAKTLVMSGKAIKQVIDKKTVDGSDIIGVFPLKGKLLNVRDASNKQVLENEEINNIKKILGLQHGKVYTDLSDLRYGGVVLFCDSDEDGHHIQGLIMNFFHCFFPSLLEINFIMTLNTPIIKAISRTETLEFYSLTDYEDWKESENAKNYRIKYYKGLGTSTSTEAKEYFTDLIRKLVKYISSDKTDEMLILAFDKKKADSRKEWLINYDRSNILYNSEKEVSYDDFINKRLIHFSNSDNERSLPSIIDGWKPSQRKIYYGATKRGLNTKNDEIKVSQLAGFVSDKASYHHGEMSLTGAIVGMAQDFTGSNNINTLFPSGQFGTKLKGGKDAASPRYIMTYLNGITKYIFRSEDNNVLKYLNDDGVVIEPEYYVPILPMILVNGSTGIGTGFSTSVPCYNPKDLITNIKLLMQEKKCKKLKPWYRGFKGTIQEDEEKSNSYYVYGEFEQLGDNKIRIFELPIGTWTNDYKEFLEEEVEKGTFITSYVANNSDTTVDFTVAIKDLEKLVKNNTIYAKLKLISKLNTTNMHLYNSHLVIHKYKTIEEIQIEFYNTRYEIYEKRKEYISNKLKHDVNILKYKMMYIQAKLDNTIIVDGEKEEDIIIQFQELGIPEMGTEFYSTELSYDYIWNMDQRSCTLQKIDELAKRIENKEEELAKLLAQTIDEIWTIELDEFLEFYEKNFENNIKPKKTKK